MKSPKGMGVILLFRSRDWERFSVYVCVHVCVNTGDVEIVISIQMTPISTLVSLVKKKIRLGSKMGYVNPIRAEILCFKFLKTS